MSLELPAQHPRERQIIRVREYVAKDKPKELRKDFAFKEPLQHGWMLPYLFGIDAMSWGRWEHWAKCMFSGGLVDSIPQIEWASGEKQYGRKMLERSLNCVTRHGDWTGWSSFEYFDYFLDWLLFGFGDPKVKEEPNERHGCEGSSARLYQIFNLEPLIAFPYDQFGDILAENNYGRRSGFFPTPVDICSMMAQMTFGQEEDCRSKKVCDPCVGTGRQLLAASNYSYRLSGMDISLTVVKATLVNGYLYAPWMVRPFPESFFADEPEAATIEATHDMESKEVAAVRNVTPVPQMEFAL